MSKKSLIIRIVIFVLLLAMLIPSLSQRLKNEGKNKDVVIALSYNNADMVLSEEELEASLTKNKEIGATTVLINEETLNSLASGGYITAIKYNVLCHKYDDESEEIIKQLSEDSKIHNDSYVIITKRDDCKSYLNRWIPLRYSADEYKKITTDLNADVYVMYEGVGEAWQITIGFDENKIKHVTNNGMNPALSMEVGAYSNTDYINEVDLLCEKYGVKYINLKPNFKSKESDKYAKENYLALCEVIKKHGLYLVLSEDPTQLSNQNPIGYKQLIESADGRVLRGYEATDYYVENESVTSGEKYYSQIINSVIDRNIRFVTVKQLVNGNNTLGQKSEITNSVIERVINKLNSVGYNTQSYSMKYDYTTNRKFVSVIAMLVMILMGITIIEWLAGKKLTKLQIVGVIGAVLGSIFTYCIAPESIINLYPTLYAIIAPCFCITAVMLYVKKVSKKQKAFVFAASTIVLTIVLILLCATVQVALLSGLDYYLNILIFRGIKLSLIIPIVYSCVAFGMLFSKEPAKLFSRENIVKVLFADIKVYWVILGGIVLGVAAMYLIRSGNVSSISPIESLMRNTITELMEARPRTKEFLVGWPAFILFLYYVKNTNCKFLQWTFSAAGSILFASIINSFCHVFTGAGIIYMRVINGIIIGAAVSVAVLIVNHIIVTVVKKHLKEGN